MYPINFTEKYKKLCLSLDYNGANSYLFVNSKEIHKFKGNNSEIVKLLQFPVMSRKYFKGLDRR